MRHQIKSQVKEGELEGWASADQNSEGLQEGQVAKVVSVASVSRVRNWLCYEDQRV